MNTSVTAALYITGWGPALAVCYAFMAQENLARTGARTWRATAFWSAVCIALGQLAIRLGIAPSMIDEPLVHGIAVINALGVAFVAWVTGAASEQKERAEATLRESEDRFRSLIQNSSDLTLVLAGGHITYASEASKKLLGYSPDAMIGHPPSEFVHPDDLGWLRDRVAAEATGLDVDRSVSMVAFGDAPGVLAGLESGSVQAGVLSAPFTVVAPANGGPWGSLHYAASPDPARLLRIWDIRGSSHAEWSSRDSARCTWPGNFRGGACNRSESISAAAITARSCTRAARWNWP